MTNSKSSDKPELLRLISGMGSYGVAESEPKDQFLKRFLPLKEHARALESNVILVVGDRGAGKTELFRAIQFPAGLRAISELSGNRLIPPQDRTDWMIGYASSESSFPPELVFRGFAKSKSPTDLQFIWLGLLLRSLQNQLPLLSPELKTATLSNDLVRMYATVEAHLVDVFSMLDSLDRELVNSDRWIIIPYDELDRVSAGDWGALAVILRGLVQFWSSYARRWERIRPKIFIRRDLFERVAIVGPDVSKIAAQRVELVWTPRLLYTLVIKRMMNQGGVLRKHFDSPDLPLREDLDLGWTPKSLTDDQLQLFVDRLCGPNMGKNPNKGKTYRWIPNHLQDGNGRVLPRSMVRLFELAAEIESDHQKAEWPTLLHHTSLRAAIERVSESRVQELEEEFPWIKSVRTALQQKKPEVPIVRTKLQSLLEIEWGDTGDRPPETSGRELLKILLDLGVFYLRTDDSRVDVRDLYLKGFGLWRRGGVAQPTSVKRG